MKPIRRQKVSSFLRLEIARIIQHEMKDPRIGFISVLAVEPTEDLKEAVVRVSLMGTPAEQRTTMRGLEAARGYIQNLLGDRTRFRNTPLIRFVQDESIERRMSINDLLEQARHEDQQAAAERSTRQDEGQEAGARFEEGGADESPTGGDGAPG